jgi:hypothetical protein
MTATIPTENRVVDSDLVVGLDGAAAKRRLRRSKPPRFVRSAPWLLDDE